MYVQRNPAFPSMLKIGYSDRLAEDRAKELSRTSVPFPFEVLFRPSRPGPKTWNGPYTASLLPNG